MANLKKTERKCRASSDKMYNSRLTTRVVIILIQWKTLLLKTFVLTDGLRKIKLNSMWCGCFWIQEKDIFTATLIRNREYVFLWNLDQEATKPNSNELRFPFMICITNASSEPLAFNSYIHSPTRLITLYVQNVAAVTIILIGIQVTNDFFASIEYWQAELVNKPC